MLSSPLLRAGYGLAFLCVLSSVVRTQAQSPAFQVDGPAFSASAKDIEEAAAKVAAEKFASATVLFERDAFMIDASGREVQSHWLICRIEGKAGVDDWAQVSERWEPWYQKEPAIHARVIQMDGKVSELDQKTITSGAASEEDRDTYTDAQIRKAPLPGLAVGAIVEEEIVLEDKSPFFAGGAVHRDFLWRSVPIIHFELTIDAPKELKVQYRTHLLPNLVFTEKETDGIRHLKFIQGYLASHQDSDIALPTHNLLGPLIEFSTGDSWASVASAYSSLAEPQIDPEMVKSLLPREASTDRLQTIQQIVSRLHKDIRYTGIEFGQASLQPQTAVEVIKRHYGDCKDKSAMLVAMLRAAGIESNLALLSTGPGIDVSPELPGMNQFDHAIVFIPSDGKGGGALWVDATAEYAQVGVLPSMDRGRLALVIRNGTNSLTMTPEAQPEDDHLTELREVAMSEYGSAHITETSLTFGEIDESYRADFGGPETREKKSNLENYAKEHYLAKALTSVEHGDGKDFSKAFVLKIDMAEAKRGNTGIDDAAVAIPFTSLFNRLPRWFTTDPNRDGDKPTPQQEEDQKRAILARAADYDVHPTITEWRYKITPPAGFVLRALPEGKEIDFGPARLTQHFEADNQGVITAVLRFNTVRSKYSVEEALALRAAVLAAYKQDMMMLMFDQAGSKLLAGGKIREALAADRALIDQHPKEALHHSLLAYAYLKAGLGDRARAEGREATRLDAKSAVGYAALAWACQFNSIGIQRVHGFDWDCAASAYKTALEIDPEDTDSALELAILNEFDKDGERYGTKAHLADAIQQYKSIGAKDKATGDRYEDNLLFDLLYSGQYKEALERITRLTASVTRDAISITATVAQMSGTAGVAAGIDRANHLAGGTQERNSALTTAGNQLLHLSLYPAAAEILAAGVEGQSNAAGVTQQIALFRQLVPWKQEYLPASDPSSVVQKMYMAVMTGTFSESLAKEVFSRHAYGSDRSWKANLRKGAESQGMLHLLAAQSGLPTNVLLDLIAGNLKFTVQGDDQTGYRVSVQSLGAKAQQLFLVHEDDGFKIVTDGSDAAEAGNEVLFLLHSGKTSQARSLLDWMRDRLHRGGGDDALEGPLLPRFWTIGDVAATDAMELAAASMIATAPGEVSSIKDRLPSIQSLFEKERSEPKRLDLALLLASAYSNLEMGQSLKPLSSEILAKYPDSYVAMELAGNSYKLEKDWAAWKQMLDTRIAKHPDDEHLLHLQIKLAEAEGDFVMARKAGQLIIDSGKATAGDYNEFAWSALFDGKVDDAVEKAAQQGNMLGGKTNFAELHTLACIYAFEGKTREAREVLLQSMTSGNLSEPNSPVWYGFGSIYEQYGIIDTAIEAYRKVERPEGPMSPTDTYVLAQMRLKALHAE